MAPKATDDVESPDCAVSPPHQSAARTAVSLRLGHATALTCHRHVIHSRGYTTLPSSGSHGRGAPSRRALRRWLRLRSPGWDYAVRFCPLPHVFRGGVKGRDNCAPSPCVLFLGGISKGGAVLLFVHGVGYAARRGRRALRCSHENEQVVAPYGANTKTSRAPTPTAQPLKRAGHRVTAQKGRGN